MKYLFLIAIVIGLQATEVRSESCQSKSWEARHPHLEKLSRFGVPKFPRIGSVGMYHGDLVLISDGRYLVEYSDKIDNHWWVQKLDPHGHPTGKSQLALGEYLTEFQEYRVRLEEVSELRLSEILPYGALRVGQVIRHYESGQLALVIAKHPRAGNLFALQLIDFKGRLIPEVKLTSETQVLASSADSAQINSNSDLPILYWSGPWQEVLRPQFFVSK